MREQKRPASYYANKARASRTGMEAIESLGGCTLVLLIAFIVRPCNFVLLGWCAKKYWDWFAIPFAAETFNYALSPLTWGYGIALCIFCHFVFNIEHLTFTKQSDSTYSVKLASLIVYGPLTTATYLYLGWIIKSICF